MAATVAILIVPVTLQVVSRYTALISSWTWTDELSRFLFIWMIMLGAMTGVREGSHFVVDVLPDLLPRPAPFLQIVTNLLVLVFALVFVWWGIQFVRFGWDQTSELAELPMAFIFMARSEERRVGKECSAGWSPQHEHKSVIFVQGDACATAPVITR